MTTMSLPPPIRRSYIHRMRSRSVVPMRQRALQRTVGQLAHQLAKAQHTATHDALTGLFNRAGLTQIWPTVTPTGVLLLDLDEFKPINDRFGHVAGDLVLRTVGARLASTAAIAVRLGGDEFVLVTCDPDPIAFAYQVAELVKAPMQLPTGQIVGVSASVGLAVIGDVIGESVEMTTALELADQAMYMAKTGKHSVVVCTPGQVGSFPGRRRDARSRVEVPL